MKRRQDDAQYVRSAAATLAFYGTLLAILAAIGLAVRWWALAGLAALLVYLYRGALFGVVRWPERADVAALIREERRALAESGSRTRPGRSS